MSPREDQRLVLSPDVLGRVLDGEVVLLDLAAGKYFGLFEPVGERLFALLTEGTTLGAVRRVLLDEFDVTPAVLDADLERLLGDLVARGLVRVSP